jgi:hypothetical protein
MYCSPCTRCVVTSGLHRCSRRYHLTYLQPNQLVDTVPRKTFPDVDKFVKDYLHLDGVLVVRLIRANANDMTTSAVVAKLYGLFKQVHKSEFSSFVCMNGAFQREKNKSKQITAQQTAPYPDVDTWKIPRADRPTDV